MTWKNQKKYMWLNVKKDNVRGWGHFGRWVLKIVLHSNQEDFLHKLSDSNILKESLFPYLKEIVI